MTIMRHFMNLLEDSNLILTESRAPLYHATGFDGAIRILARGVIQDNAGDVSLSRDPRYRYSGAGAHDENNWPFNEAGHGPIQFILDGNALRARHKVEPFDMVQSMFWIDKGSDPEGIYGDWRESDKLRRQESEERVTLAPGKNMKIDGIVTAIVLEPVTIDWLRFWHYPEDRPWLVGPGTVRDFPFTAVSKHVRRRDGDGVPMVTKEGRDYRGVSPDAYRKISVLAAQRNIDVIDRR